MYENVTLDIATYPLFQIHSSVPIFKKYIHRSIIFSTWWVPINVLRN